MTLYYAPGACSLAPHIILHEAGIEADLRKVDLKAKKVEGGADFRKVSPNGYVPALELQDGQVLTEAAVILQYIADRAPGAKLAPPNGTMERYRVDEMLNFIATELHKPFGALFDPSLKDLREPMLAKIGQRLDRVQALLHGKSYLVGDAFTIADAYLAVILSWADHVQLDLSKWPDIAAYRKRILDRPAAQKALKAEGLLH